MFASKNRVLLLAATLLFCVACHPVSAQSADTDEIVAEIFKQPAKTDSELLDQLAQVLIAVESFRIRKPNAELDPIAERVILNASKHDSPQIRRSSVRALIRAANFYRRAGLANAALELIEDESGRVQEAAIEGFSQSMSIVENLDFDNDLLVEKLNKQLTNDRPEVKLASAKFLFDLGIQEKSNLRILVDSYVQDFRPRYQQPQNFYTGITKHREQVIQWLLDNAEQYPTPAISAIGLMAPESETAFDQLMEFAKSGTVLQRFPAMRVLSEFKAKRDEIREVLLEATTDEDGTIRETAIEQLPLLAPKPSQLVEICCKLMQEDTDLEVGRAAALSLATVTTDFEELVVSKLESILDSESSRARANAMHFVSNAKAKKLMDSVAKIANREFGEERLMAIDCLASLELTAEEFTPVLLQNLQRDGVGANLKVMKLLAKYEFEKKESTRNRLVEMLEQPELCGRAISLLKLFDSVDSLPQLLAVKIRQPFIRSYDADQILADFSDATKNMGEPAYELLKTAACSGETVAEARALFALAKRGEMDEDLWAKAVSMLENDNDDVFATALRVIALKETPEERDLQTLLDMTTSPNKRRNFILTRLGAMGTRISALAPDVASRIMSGDGPTKSYYILLHKIGGGAKSALPELKQHLQEQDAKLQAIQLRRLNLIGVLGALEDNDPQPYIEMVSREFDGPFRAYAVSALGKIANKHPSAMDRLIEVLPDDAAINEIVRLGPLAKRALPKLQELRKQDPELIEIMYATWIVSGSPTEAIAEIRRCVRLKENEELGQFSADRTIEYAIVFLMNFAGNEELEIALDEFSKTDSPILKALVKRLRKKKQSQN